MNNQAMMEVLTTIVKEGRIEDGKIFIDKYAIMIAPNLKDPDKTPKLYCNLKEDDNGNPLGFDRLDFDTMDEYLETIHDIITK